MAEGGDLAQAVTRGRIEIRSQGGSFIPLIDGPVVGFESRMSAQPGQSALTIILQDDSVFLNRDETIAVYENLLDHEIAAQIFAQFPQIAATEIETTPTTGSALPPVVYQRGTAMQLLRSLAKRQGMCAHVLSGDSPGQSVGVFKMIPTAPNGLPPLVLIGPDRNMESFDVHYNAQSPAAFKASILRITDKSVVGSASSYGDVEFLGGEPAAAEDNSGLPAQLLPPDRGETVDLDRAVLAEATFASFAYEASGQVLSRAYPAILSPYQVITVKLGNTPLSGDYIITRVTHTITKADYSQSFSLKRNATSSGGNGSPPLGSIF